MLEELNIKTLEVLAESVTSQKNISVSYGKNFEEVIKKFDIANKRLFVTNIILSCALLIITLFWTYMSFKI